MVIRYDRPNLLVATKGHPFDKVAFCGLFNRLQGFTWTHVEQPAAARLLDPSMAEDFAAIVFYDLPGLRFRSRRPPDLIEPTDAMKQGFEALLATGKPLVFLHHAIAGWPTWERYAEAIGTRFFYRPGSYKGRDYPDSGYRSSTAYEAEVVGEHPVTEGLPGRFAIDDELYLMPLLEPNVVPLVRARFDFVAGNFFSAAAAVEGRGESREGWSHPPGTDLIAWARRAGQSPVVVIQCGNDGKTFSNPAFERLLGNAIGWVTSPQAAAWAAGHDGSVP